MFVMGEFKNLQNVITGNAGLINDTFGIRYYKEMPIYPFAIAMLIIITIALIACMKFKPEIHRVVSKVIFKARKFLIKIRDSRKSKKIVSKSDIERIINSAGYEYNEAQDIFYSTLYPWQRSMGYCHFYDEASPLLGIIIDCEPIKFMYKGKLWLIEFWKGQYGMTTGCEIGLYKKAETVIDIPEVFNGNFYEAVDDSELLDMELILKRDNTEVFRRMGKTWWLTGFKLGMFSEPSELIMNLSITFKDTAMFEAFVKSLMDVGYLEEEIEINKNTVALEFNKPRTEQPTTRKIKMTSIIQDGNKENCERYQKIAAPYDNFFDVIKAIENEAPDLLEEIIDIGKFKELKNLYEQIKVYMS